MLQYTSKQFSLPSSFLRINRTALVSMINDRYKLLKRVGSGTFGLIFSAKNVNTDELVAVKLEPTSQADTLTHEAAVLQRLAGTPGIPTLRYYGIPDHNRYMVIDLFDKTLQGVSFDYKKAVPVPVVRMYALQMMQIISAVHDKGFVHRDIKPENFMIKSGGDFLYLIDFGLARTYIDGKTGKHRDNKHRLEDASQSQITGTARYVSTHIHDGNEPSRRDDLISAMYIISYLLKGRLPWKTCASNEALAEMKKSILPEELFLDLPASYVTLFKYLSELSYEQKPDYAYIMQNW
jgi:serine/threonine protein kinase